MQVEINLIMKWNFYAALPKGQTTENLKEKIVSLSAHNHFVLNSNNYGNGQKTVSLMINLQHVKQYLKIHI